MRGGSLRDRELRADGPVRVVPAERRRIRVGRVRYERPRPVVRALARELEDPVARTVVDGIGRDDRRQRRAQEAPCHDRPRAGQPGRELAEGSFDVQSSASSSLAVSASTNAFQSSSPDAESMTIDQAARRPLPVGCQPSLSVIGFSEIPPAETTVARDGPLAWLITCRSVGVPSCSAAAAASTASVGSTRDGAGGRVRQPADEAPAGEDDAPVGRDADGHMPAEDLAILEALVQIDVGDAAGGAPVPAGDGEVGDVGACDAERSGLLVEIALRDLARIRGRGGPSPDRRQRAGYEHQPDERCYERAQRPRRC